jgi:glutaredoxin
MTAQLILYSRADCGLCEEMKETIRQVATKIPLELEEIDVDGSVQLKEEFGAEVPVLFINGRKAFKYTVTARELARRLGGHVSWRRWGRARKGA